MASHHQKPKSRSVQKTPGQVNPENAKPKPPVKNKRSLWQLLDDFFEKRLNVILIISLILSSLLGGFLFDVKISTGGDDSHYVEMAHNFLKGDAFPSWHGPLYSVFLSLPMLIFGVNIVWLKIISFLFVLAHLVLFFLTFRNRISPAVLAFVMLILAVNSSILYFASQTYSEAMYMFLQSLAIYIFVNIYTFTGTRDGVMTFRQEALQWLILGFFVFLVSLTRNIGIVCLMAMVFFLIIEKRFRGAVMLTLSYVVFLIPFRLYKTLVWNEPLSGGPDQISEMFSKNPYNQAMGTEDFAGVVTRFVMNAKAYLSKHFMIGIGLQDPASTDKSGLITIILVVLFLIALYFAFRRSKIMLFISIYLGAAIASTFIALHQSWDQMRMIVIFLPMLLLLLLWGIQQLSLNKRYTYVGFVLLIFVTVIFLKTFDQTTDKIKVNRKVLARNIKGNMYYGFTPDWQNFLRMSEWVGHNIPEGKLVASRKPSMSYIYSKGREFYGMYRIPTEQPGEFIKDIKKRTGELIAFPNEAVKNNWPAGLQWEIKKANVAYIAEGSDLYGLYNFRGQQGNEVIQQLYSYNVQPFQTDSLLKLISLSPQTCYAVSPDTLINNLRKNKVEYVIVANLRANPNVKTGNIINNIQRYLYFVELKYPGILELVHQVGRDDDEPAWLYRINYELYGL